ncbi:hypothetical protein [Dactylosporangium sp. CA-092794]|uniref:hypothetical protein n=1 Tax=Dactylosporangium sp. CA-092794 TaxID=3239929 RepID=UPI003D9359E8
MTGRPVGDMVGSLPFIPRSRDGDHEHSPPGARLPRPGGRFPVARTVAMIALASSLGVVAMAAAYAAGRAGLPSARALYWLAVALIFVPVAAGVLARRGVKDSGAAFLVGWVVAELYLVKWMYSPDEFRFPDELQHWRGTTDVLDSGRLFVPNDALPVSTHYPALEVVTAALVSITGLSVNVVGAMVAGLAHALFVGALYIVVARVSGSGRHAAIASLVYCASPHFLFFDSMFLYQTLALPFFMLVVWVARMWRRGGADGPALLLFGVAAIVVTAAAHHVTSMVMVATLLLVALCELAWGRPRQLRPLVLTVVAAAVVTAWLTFVAGDAAGYLRPPAEELAGNVAELVHGRLGAFGEGSAPLIVPLSDRVIAVAGLLITAMYLVRGWWQLRRRRSIGPWHLAFLLGSSAFGIFMVIRLVASDGAELSGRASTFVFVPVAFVVAAVIEQDGLYRWRAVRNPAILGAVAVSLLFASGITNGWPPHWARLPGGFLVSGFERSVEPEGVQAARWVRDHVGPHRRWATDFTSYTLLSTYGEQQTVRNAAPLYYDRSVTADDRKLVADQSIGYVYVDLRLAAALPASGSYFPVDPLANRHTSPLPLDCMTKFDAVPGISRIYDSGDIRLYDIRNSDYVP